MKLIRRLRHFFVAKAHIQPIFSRQVAYIRQASSALLAMVNSDDITERKKLEKEVKLCEVQGDAMLTVKELGSTHYSGDETVYLTFNPKKINVFDTKSEKLIKYSL